MILSKARCVPFALIAVCALGALGGLGATAASAALPEISPWGTKGPEDAFKTEGRINAEFTSSKWSVDCATTQLSGHFVNSKEVVAEEAFSECSAHIEPFTTQLRGTLGYLNKAAHLVGLRLEPATGTIWTKHFLVQGTLSGKVIGTVPVLGKLSKTLNLTYTSPGAGKQRYEQLEGGPLGEHLIFEPGAGPENTALVVEQVLHFGNQVEIRG